LTTGRILAIDFGDKRLGFALSDPGRVIAYSLTTIENLSSEKTKKQIQALIAEHQVSMILVGMPLNLKGEKAFKAEIVIKFVEQLKTRLDIEVQTYDERFTTTIAHQTIIASGKSPSRERKKIDQIAATILLQSYLDYIRNQKPVAE
jgi:putative Holliday junction resolvase